MVEVQYLEQYYGVWVYDILRFRVDKEFFINKNLLSFQTPLESPSYLKSQQLVAKGSNELFRQV
jgi:hypothetical protein